jgi:hypothetical protein
LQALKQPCLLPPYRNPRGGAWGDLAGLAMIAKGADPIETRRGYLQDAVDDL